MSRLSIVNVCVLTLLLQPTAAPRLNAQESSGSHLKGVTAIAVHVNLNGTANVSLIPTQLETALEQRLRQAGIAVVAGQAPRPYGTQGNLWANVFIIRRPGDSQSVLSIETKLYGSVVLAGSNEKAEAITWETGRLVIVPASETDTRLRENLNFLTDEFSRAYLAANLK
jgi:hypothetical protein